MNMSSEDIKEDDAAAIRALPKEVGVLFLVAGVGGLLLPGPIGTPFLIVGGVILWPKAFMGLEARFQSRFPELHKKGVKQVVRFVNDLNRRYPLPNS